jgi:hypothetical protein
MAWPSRTRDEGRAILAFQLAAQGASHENAQALNAAGYRTAGNVRRGVFTKDTVRDMLANRFTSASCPSSSRAAAAASANGAWRPIPPSLMQQPSRQPAGRSPPVCFVWCRAPRVVILQPLRPAALRALRRADAGDAHGEGARALPLPQQGAGLGCTGSGSFLDTYEQQIVTDLAAFALPDDWKETILDDARRRQGSADETVQLRQQLEGRLGG